MLASHRPLTRIAVSGIGVLAGTSSECSFHRQQRSLAPKHRHCSSDHPIATLNACPGGMGGRRRASPSSSAMVDWLVLRVPQPQLLGLVVPPAGLAPCGRSSLGWAGIAEPPFYSGTVDDWVLALVGTIAVGRRPPIIIGLCHSLVDQHDGGLGWDNDGAMHDARIESRACQPQFWVKRASRDVSPRRSPRLGA